MLLEVIKRGGGRKGKREREGGAKRCVHVWVDGWTNGPG